MGKNISYNARTFDDYKEQLKSLTQKYYPTIINDFNDASIGQWFMDLNAAVSDDLGYLADRMFQEGQLGQAQVRKSLLNIARTNNLRVDGKRASILEAEWSCIIPINGNSPDFRYAPILYKGTQASGGGQKFELAEDLDFGQQFDKNGISNRSFIPIRTSNGTISGYKVTKTCLMTSSESRVYKQPLNSTDMKPFIEIILPENNVLAVESIKIKDGYDVVTPSVREFMAEVDEDGNPITDRWYEVSNLTEDKIFKKNIIESTAFAEGLLNNITGTTITGATIGNTFVEYLDDNSRVYSFIPSVGEWTNVTRKFITEYTDKGYCKIIFGGGINELDLNGKLYNASNFAKYQMNKIMNNQYLGELPPSNSTVYVYYTVGGGAVSNIAAGAMSTITYRNMFVEGPDALINSNVRSSLAVINTTPSISGRDEFSIDELRYLVKYNNSAQDRCVTIKDYLARILMMPSEFGAPLKIGVSETNNKILITLLGLNYDGTLSKDINIKMIDNMIEYLSEYRMINDYVEIQPGKIINLEFQVDVTVDNSQDQANVAKAIALYIGNYMDINNHKLGEEIYVSKMKSAIGNITGVKNLIDLRIYNLYGDGYSTNHTKQNIYAATQEANKVQIDLVASDGVLYSDDDTIFEIKNPKVNIIINTKYK